MDKAEFKIRKARENDISSIMKIYAHARTFMAEHGNPNQWGPNNWPPESLIAEDIEQGRCYLCILDERTVGVFYFTKGLKVDPAYDVIYDGSWQGDDTYGVVHRIASDHSVKGVGSFCVKWAFDQCGNIRMDTHPDNRVMQNMLEKLGFQYCGIIYVQQDTAPRLAYEKYIK